MSSEFVNIKDVIINGQTTIGIELGYREGCNGKPEIKYLKRYLA